MTGAASRREWDAIVVGLGGLGSAAAYWLATRFGDRVLGLEQFEHNHDNGASRDHSRIIRLSYHRPHYVRLARRAYETWSVANPATPVTHDVPPAVVPEDGGAAAPSTAGSG